MKKFNPHYGFFTLIFFLLFATSFAQVGINDANPRTTLDINGALSLREGGALTMGTNNNNVSLGAVPYSVYRISGPTGAFRIGGLQPVTDADGQMVVLENTTTHAMTIRHNAGSSAVNRIFVAGGRDLVLSGQYATVTLVYNTTHNRWVVTNYSDNRYGDNIQSVKGTTDTSTSSASFADMADMSITFTPNHSTVYVSFSSSGFFDLTSGVPAGAYGLFRLRKTAASTGTTVEAGFSCIATDFDYDDLAGFLVGTSFNSALTMFPVSVTPGESTTLTIQWARDGTFVTDLLNPVSSVPDDAHRVLTIFD